MQTIYKNIGFIYKAQKLLIGADLIVENIRKRKVKIVLVSMNASSKTIKNIQNKCQYYKIELILLNDYENNLSKIFKNKKVKVMAVSDSNFYKLLKK